MKNLILVTGFEPFGEHSRNPSSEIARSLDETIILGARVQSLELPVDTARAPEQLIAAIEELKPNVVLSLGLAGGRRVLSVEKIPVNLLNFEIPDNAGVTRRSELIRQDGPAGYFATLPVEELVRAIRDAAVPSDLSMSAGGFLCNQIMYTSLHYYAEHGQHRPSGFIHLPCLPDMVVNDPSLPSMSYETIKRGVQAALNVIATKLDS